MFQTTGEIQAALRETRIENLQNISRNIRREPTPSLSLHTESHNLGREKKEESLRWLLRPPQSR
jgi:hypothetical protein